MINVAAAVEFEWDEIKNRRNQAKHGVSFEEAAAIFRMAVLEEADDRRNYGEQRIRAYGFAQGRLLCVVYTIRNDRVRIISARRAGRAEREVYRAAHP